MPKAAEYALKIGIKRALLFISDIHGGSLFGLMPEKYEIKKTGQVVHASPGQKSMLNYFKGISKIIDQFKIDMLLLGGDMVQGTNKKELGAGNIICQIGDQIDMTTELLGDLIGNRKVHIHGVSGTKYHTSQDYEAEATVTDRLGGTHHGKVWNFQLKGSNKVIHLSHGASNAAIYPEMLSAREMLFHKEAAYDGKLPRFNMILHGHRHFAMHLDKPGCHVVQNPCWQRFNFDSEYMLKQYAKWQPDIGYSVILVDEADRFHVIQFTMPNMPDVKDFLEDA